MTKEEIAKRLRTVREYTAQELGADAFKGKAKRCILVSLETRNAILRLLEAE